MKYVLKILVALPLLFFAQPSFAASCADEANILAEEKGGEIVGVQVNGNQCKIKIRIPGKNGNPPRVETITVSK